LQRKGRPESPARSFPGTKTRRKNVVLGTDTLEISPKALGYAAGLSCRMGAGLEILHLISPDDKGDMDAGPGTLVGGGVGLTEVTQRPEGGRTIYHVVPWRGTLIDGLLHILEGRRDIISIVIGRPVQGNKRLSGLLKRLGCPVIIPEKGAA